MIRSRSMRMVLLVAVMAPCVGCDQVTKSLAREHLAQRPPASWMHGVFHLQYAENNGAFMSAGSALDGAARKVILTGGAALMLAAATGYLLLAPAFPMRSILSLALIISGGLGNLWDRVTNAGAVIDFMNIGIGSLRTGIFNFADVFLVLGVLLFVFSDKALRDNC